MVFLGVKISSLQIKCITLLLDFRKILLYFRKHTVLYGKKITLQIIVGEDLKVTRL